MDKIFSKPLRFIPLILGMVLLAGCTAMSSPPLPSPLIPVLEPAKRYRFQTYSVVPPPGGSWSIGQMDQFDIVFGKQLETRSHTFTANAMALPFIIQFDKPEDFLEFIKGKNSSELRSKRFRLVEMDGSLDPLRGPFCARLFIKVEDHGTPIKDIPFLIMDLYQLACVHPDTPDWVISVGYSERYQPGEQNPALLIEGESFIRNMQFIPLNKN